MSYTVDNFWKSIITHTSEQSQTLPTGWHYVTEGLDTFMEAPLTIEKEFGPDQDPLKAEIILVSAPGAVGKSTLARQIAYETGAIYIDLSEADAVGGNTISGGIYKAKLHLIGIENKAGIIIDGLDEARIRVTQDSVNAFINDIYQISQERETPTVLLGRTGAIQDAYIALLDYDIKVSVLEIGYYDLNNSIEFAAAKLKKLLRERPILEAHRTAISLLIEALKQQTQDEGDRFAGYAPVLQAVAERISGESNPSATVSAIKQGKETVTLQTITSSIMDRERGKLKRLEFNDKNLYKTLYSKKEQLDRLVSIVYGKSTPQLPEMDQHDSQIYDTALETWQTEHPFLKGNMAPSSAVFEAIICSHALQTDESKQIALHRELNKGAASNPFLSEFYPLQDDSLQKKTLPAEHIGIIYSSLRARLSIGDSANLSIDAHEDAKEEDTLRATVEVTLNLRNQDKPRSIEFETLQCGTLQLGSHIEDIDIYAPLSVVEIGTGAEAHLVAPINIQCEALNLKAQNFIVESNPNQLTNSVFLEASNFNGPSMTSTPVLHGKASLAVLWPGAKSHPWTNYAAEPTPVENPNIHEALQRFRKFIISFRSHSKNSLARFKGKIEHSRMTKGTGNAVLNLLMQSNIVTLNGAMYYLNSQRLAEVTGASFHDCNARKFKPETIDFVRQIFEEQVD